MKKIIWCLFIIVVSCSKEELENIKIGCKPSVIETRDSLQFGDEGYSETYTYEGEKLIQLGNFEYEYDGNKVSKIYFGPYRFEEYSYDSQNRVVSSKKYRKENEEEAFELVEHFNYEYSGDHVNKLKDILYLKEEIFYRDEQTSNIDSIKFVDANGSRMTFDYFEYDEKPNIHENVSIPKYDFKNWIIKSTKNNILKYEKRKPNSSNYEVVGYYSVDIIYNEFDFPSLVTINFSNGGKRVRNISYVNCE